MSALFNEFEPYAAQWLRNLVAAGHIATGGVDGRSIKELRADDVRGFRQAHFFAGVGVWSRALRLAGWPDDAPVWTGSCPCQPFSDAGQGRGVDDERHLWPEWYRLIRECRPAVVLGEQVASKGGLAWLDLVRADLEGAGYAFAAFDLCAAGFGAPHIRQRLYFAGIRLADTDSVAGGQGRAHERWSDSGGASQPRARLGGSGGALGLAHHHHHRREGLAPSRTGSGLASGDDVDGCGAPRGLGEPIRSGLEGLAGHGNDGRQPGRLDAVAAGPVAAPGPTNGHWADVEWLPCRDGKWRPTQPGLRPLAHGAASRVGRLRAYGNAIVAPQAVEFIRAVMGAFAGGAA